MEQNSFNAKPVTKREPLRISTDEEPIRLVEPIDWKKNINNVAPDGVTTESKTASEKPVEAPTEPNVESVSKPVEAPKKAPEAVKQPIKPVSEPVKPASVVIPEKPAAPTAKPTSLSTVAANAKKAEVAKPVVLEPVKTVKKRNAQKSTTWNFQLKKVDANNLEEGGFQEVRSVAGEIQKPQSTRYMFTGSMMFIGSCVLIIFPFLIPIVNADFNPWWSLIFTIPIGLIVMIAGATMSSVGLLKSIIDWFRKR